MVRPGQPFIGMHSPLARGADRQTPDSSLASPEGPLHVSYSGGGPPTDPRTEAQTLTAWYVDCHAELGRTKPNKRQTGIIAQCIGEKLDGGAKPEHMREAIGKLVEKGKGPSLLTSFVSEVEASRVKTGASLTPFVPNMRPGEPTRATAKHLAEAAAGFKKLAEGIGKPMP